MANISLSIDMLTTIAGIVPCNNIDDRTPNYNFVPQMGVTFPPYFKFLSTP